jgi:hypothetical protein
MKRGFKNLDLETMDLKRRNRVFTYITHQDQLLVVRLRRMKTLEMRQGARLKRKLALRVLPTII